jgi:hypothetical protein
LTLIIRPHYAYSILRAADQALEYGISKLTIIEFGVASGAGLLNMCRLAERTSSGRQVSSFALSALIPGLACLRPPITEITLSSFSRRFPNGR